MSSTKQGTDRPGYDIFLTPSWAVHRLLEAVDLPGGRWLEPGAGNGSIIKAVNEVRDGVDWTAVEVRECEAELYPLVGDQLFLGDYLQPSTPDLRQMLGMEDSFDVVIGNPPFNQAQAFLERSLDLGKHVVFLLRLNYLETVTRADFFRANPPDVYVLPQRPNFDLTKKSKRDSIAYAWFHWPPRRDRPYGQLRVLAVTPTKVSERRRRPVEATNGVGVP